jgi:hypothetical protein
MMKRKLLALVGVVVMAGVAVAGYLGFSALTDGSASAGGDPQEGSVHFTARYSYAVKMACNDIFGKSDPLIDTVVNIHNPYSSEKTFALKVINFVIPDSTGQILKPSALLVDSGMPVGNYNRVAVTLPGNNGIALNCDAVRQMITEKELGIDVFLVIESPKKLHVATTLPQVTTAFYAGAATGSKEDNGVGSSIDVEYIQPLRVYHHVEAIPMECLEAVEGFCPDVRA